MSDIVILAISTTATVIITVGAGFLGMSYKFGKREGRVATEIDNLTTEVSGVKAHCNQQMHFMNGKVRECHGRIDGHLKNHPVS